MLQAVGKFSLTESMNKEMTISDLSTENSGYLRVINILIK